MVQVDYDCTEWSEDSWKRLHQILKALDIPLEQSPLGEKTFTISDAHEETVDVWVEYVRLEAASSQGERPCKVCGSTDSTDFYRFRQQAGLIVIWAQSSTDGVFCPNCALTIGRKTQLSTLIMGWWGIRSFFWNFAVVGANVKSLNRAKTLRRDSQASQDRANT